MWAFRSSLPQLDAGLFLTDGGIETTMIFDEGFDLPYFAAFPLLDIADGRAALHRYFASYVEIAVRDEVGIVLETPTWRANSDWGALLGYDDTALEAVNRDAVALALEQRRRHERPSTPVVISGRIGPRCDGYRVTESIPPYEARPYHRAQTNDYAYHDSHPLSALTLARL